MKRTRDDGYVTSQVKRPATSCGGEASGTQQLARGAQRLTTDDALAYLKAVKDMFKDRKEKYDEFLEVMKEFKAQRIDTTGVIDRVKELFNGHRKLILGFNTFLPKGYEITLPPEEEPSHKKQPVEFDQAINYVNKIKTRFQNDDQVYKAFLDILNLYRKGNKSISQVYEEVASLFNDHRDLLEEFTYFLPDNSGAPLVSHALNPTRVAPVTQVRRDEKPSASGLKHHFIEKKERNITTQSDWEQDHEQSAERPSDHDIEKPSIKNEKENKKRFEKEKEKKDGKERRDRDGDEKDIDQDREREMNSTQITSRDKRRSAKKANELIRKQTQGVEGGDGFAGHQITSPSLDEKTVYKSVCQEFRFVDRVKARLRNHDTYQEFLKCLHIYSKEIINRTQLQSLVSDILGKHSDLMDGFNEFLSQCENIDDFINGEFNRKAPWTEGSFNKSVKAEKDRDCDRERDMYDREKERDREREKDRSDKSPLYAGKDQTVHKVTSLPNKDKYLNKPISELDLSSSERCTPSYRLLPKNYPKPIASQRNDLAKSVLNDFWVSVTSGSEDYSFKHMRKNQYEESLFRCEDDRFELDMLLESAAATIKRMEVLLDKLKDGTGKQDGQIQIDDYLTALNLRCIERLYSDHGLDAIDSLRKCPALTVPVILSRLKQKQEEWSKCRAEMNKVWAEIYAKNYHKSLDHRSFYFKQQDKKSLSTKGLLAEIKEINEKKKKEDDVLLAIAAGDRRSINPNLQFEYSDPDIHEDVYQIIKYSCDEVCTTLEQLEKVMRVWTTFVEPILGVPPRLHGAEDTEDAVKVKSTARKPGVKGITQNDSAVVGDTGHANGKQVAFNGNGRTVIETARGESGIENLQSGLKNEGVKSQLPTSIAAGNSISRMLLVQNDKAGESKAPNMTEPISVPMITNHITGQVTGENVSPLAAKAWLYPSEDAWSYGISEGVSSLKVEREEGELSPSPDVEDRQNTFTGDARNAIPDGSVPSQGKDNCIDRQFRNRGDGIDDEVDCAAEVGGVHDTDMDDEGEESAHRSTEESENGSEGGEEASRSESRDADDCSQDHEEEDDDDAEHDENDGKAESEGEAEVIPDVNDICEGASMAVSDFNINTAKPLAKHVPSSMMDDVQMGSKIFYGNDSFYVLFRLHQTLYDRILSAKKNSLSAECKWKSSKDTHPPDLYAKFMTTLFSLLDGSSDNTKFEDDCRAIIGTQSYVLFTLDKLIFKLVKQLQAIASDETGSKLLQLYRYESLREADGFLDIVYHANTGIYLHDENVYRFECTKNPTCLSIQLIERGSEKFESGSVTMDPSFASYLNNTYLSPVPDKMNVDTVFLARNKRKFACEDEYTSVCKAMKGVHVVNGLEYKITCNTSKVSYVLDTEDFLFRKKFKKNKIAGTMHPMGEVTLHFKGSKRAVHFNKWVDKRFELIEKVGVPDTQ